MPGFFNSQRMISQYVANAYFPEKNQKCAESLLLDRGVR